MSALVTSIRELCDYLGLSAESLGYSEQAARDFPFRVPRSLMERMQKGNPDDPILRQVLPHRDELDQVPGFTHDPVGESGYSPVSGLLLKYPNRALLILTGACAINCRYCFRRHFPYGEQEPSLSQAIDWLARHEEIREVIWSGGDPLTLSQRRLVDLYDKLAAIPHLSRLRIHSRQPVVSPDCVTPEFVAMLANPRFQTVLVVHVDHPAELNEDVAVALRKLRQAGVTLLNQSVLLKGINDDVRTLAALSEQLFSLGILPYYLHQLDKVAGAAHFAVSDEQALALHRQLRESVSGYLVPRLVVELPGHLSKVPLADK